MVRRSAAGWAEAHPFPRPVPGEGRSATRRAANGYLVASCLEAKGALAKRQGDSTQAREVLEEALGLARRRHDRVTEAAALCRLGRLARAEDDRKAAASLHHQPLVTRHRMGDRPGVVQCLEAVGALAIDGNDPVRAVRLFAAAESLRDLYGYRRPSEDEPAYSSDLAAAREAMAPEDFETEWARGAKLSLEAAVAYAGRGCGRQRRAPGGWGALTPTECQVVELVAEGLSNRDIGARLLISPRTVQSHLRHVFAKLGLATRSALVREVHRR